MIVLLTKVPKLWTLTLFTVGEHARKSCFWAEV